MYQCALIAHAIKNDCVRKNTYVSLCMLLPSSLLNSAKKRYFSYPGLVPNTYLSNASWEKYFPRIFSPMQLLKQPLLVFALTNYHWLTTTANSQHRNYKMLNQSELKPNKQQLIALPQPARILTSHGKRLRRLQSHLSPQHIRLTPCRFNDTFGIGCTM